MTDNNFQLAAALLADAADFVGRMPLGITELKSHPFGALRLMASHTREADHSHKLILWALDRCGAAAAAEATQSTPTAVPATRILAFRADYMVFSDLGDWTFLASSDHNTYTLTAHIGANSWDLSVDGEHHAAYTSIDTAVDAIHDHATEAAR
ncbi:hypothetical protein OOJ09_31775 [Mesorhizobium qingshengii]|uniref:Uncharacterized protein n=1 Tax=Mesorhizobium qingshengii TaxID=1165689 RepID=A0ABT4R4J2_9HYPH|nr:hypothetical protein [Mesorhizobium qingshengii]MCZ8548748.1 hypothetical protein [Mesorhizobium qingshengii]